MKVISWNCRGLGSKGREEAMIDLISLHQPDILLIQETKLEETAFLQISKKFWKKNGAAALSSRGASGGIGTLWDDRKYDVMDTKISSHWILTVLRQINTNTLVSIFNIYAPNSYGEKTNCWNLIREERSNLQGNVILAGDLNLTLSLNEKRGGSRSRDPITDMVEDIIMTWNLTDIKPATGKYTWTNRRFGPGHIAARLDRFLIQDNFLLLGLIISSKILPFGGSDHKPILLEMEQEKNLGPIPFRFNSMWAKHEDFLKIVAGSWIYPVTGSPFFVWEENLRRLKKILKIWAKLLPKPNDSKLHAAQALGAHQAEMEDKLVTITDIQMETKLHLTLHVACRQEAD